jgi:hypothetical protein
VEKDTYDKHCDGRIRVVFTDGNINERALVRENSIIPDILGQKESKTNELGH